MASELCFTVPWNSSLCHPYKDSKDAIVVLLTMVITALAVSRTVQTRTGLPFRNVLKQLRPPRSATTAINGTTQTFAPVIHLRESESNSLGTAGSLAWSSWPDFRIRSL